MNTVACGAVDAAERAERFRAEIGLMCPITDIVKTVEGDAVTALHSVKGPATIVSCNDYLTYG